ncbi:two pore domain potassium channel family protein [Streptomyces triticagri]|uniref:Two pore domain potassium channel family protein n=1 Tax=Streptomyces triticagri TaxID=2293568 RepID=A0A372MC32_9ACTN|nr:two pore domain potassium channel family protein [Streptomyces triticagri]
MLGIWTAITVTAYFLLPLHSFGPHRPAVSWTVFGAGLAVVAAGLLIQIPYAANHRAGTAPAWILAGLMCFTVLLFASSYYVLAQHQGEFSGLDTRVDALYFTLVTLATIGYGDVSPTGQSARLVTVLQIVYSLVFLTAAATALTRHIQLRLMRRGRRTPRDGAGDG